MITIASYEDPTFSTKMVEFEKAVQAAPKPHDGCAQTVWRYPQNQTTQYEPRYLTDAEKVKELANPDLASFAKDALPLYEID